MSALSGIDQALWDIAGKHYGVPFTSCWVVGRARSRARLRALGLAETATKCFRPHAIAWMVPKHGYTAFKTGPGGKWRAHEPPSRIDAFVSAPI